MVRFSIYNNEFPELFEKIALEFPQEKECFYFIEDNKLYVEPVDSSDPERFLSNNYKLDINFSGGKFKYLEVSNKAKWTYLIKFMACH